MGRPARIRRNDRRRPHIHVGRRPSSQKQSAPLAADIFHPEALFSALLNQLYIGQPYVPRNIYVPVDFEDRDALEDLLSEQLAAEGSRATRVHIEVPQRGEKRSLIDLAATNAKQSYDQRFRIMKPNQRMIQEALQDALGLPDPPKRIECFRHLAYSRRRNRGIYGCLGRWRDEEIRLSQIYYQVREGVDDFASMREVITRRYKRLRDDQKPLPSLILVDGGLGQLHSAAAPSSLLKLSTSR